jgi:phage terminase small subunit
MLTAKQRTFASAIADGSDQTSAYKLAYEAQNMSPIAVWVESSRLRRHPKVALKIEELNAEAEAVRRDLVVSREEAILARLEHEALNAKNDSARIRALELLGKAAGLFTEKIEIEQVERSAEAIERDIRHRLHHLGLVNEE